MAGTILISKGVGLTVSTVDFDYFCGKIRAEFLKEDQAISEMLFEPLDEGGMTFISAMEFDIDEFKVFAQTVRASCKSVMSFLKVPC